MPDVLRATKIMMLPQDQVFVMVMALTIVLLVELERARSRIVRYQELTRRRAARRNSTLA